MYDGQDHDCCRVGLSVVHDINNTAGGVQRLRPSFTGPKLAGLCLDVNGEAFDARCRNVAAIEF